jgi:hypothetical protein
MAPRLGRIMDAVLPILIRPAASADSLRIVERERNAAVGDFVL